MAVALTPVTSRTDLNTFIRLPAALYRDDRRYRAPLTLERRYFLDPRKSPFFTHGEAQYWLAERDGRAVGRISAQIDYAANGPDFEGVGFFGCLDAIDDRAVVQALLGAAEGWLRARGRRVARGPFLLSMSGEPGLLVEGADEPPLLMASWHPPYLGGLVEACGYRGVRDLHYYRVPMAAGDGAADLDQFSRLRADLTIRAIDGRRIGRDIATICSIYNDAWQDNWGFVPLLPADLKGFKGDMLPLLVSDMGFVAEHDGQTVGMALGIGNVYDLTAGLGPDPGIAGLATILGRRLSRRYETGRILLLGVRKTFRGTLIGLSAAASLIDALVRRGRREGCVWFEAGWVLDVNTALIKILKRANGQRVRTLRLYDRALAGN